MSDSNNIRPCPYCNQNFASTDELTEHILQNHHTTEIREIISQFLETRTTSAANRSPSTSSSVTCPICNRFYVSDEALRQHHNACHAATTPPTTAVSTTPTPTIVNNYNNYNTTNNNHYTTPVPPPPPPPSHSQSTSTHHVCIICPAICDSAESLLQHYRQFHPTRNLCTICGKHYGSRSTLYAHRSRKHPDNVRPYSSSSSSNNNSSRPPAILQLPDDIHHHHHASRDNLPTWRSVLTADAIRQSDNVCTTSSENEIYRKIVHFLASHRLRSLNYNEREVYHCIVPTIITLQELQDKLSDYVKEVLPFVCKCFCNLLDPLAKLYHPNDFNEEIARALFCGPILNSKDTKWHFHCIIIFKKGKTYNRQIQRRIHRLIKRRNQNNNNNEDDDNQNVKPLHRFKRIINYLHLVNTVLYISGRRSVSRVNTHTFHSLGFYISENQKTTIRKKLFRPSFYSIV